MRLNKHRKCQQRIQSWLKGETFERKVRRLEKGYLATCIKCGRTFFDRDTASERSERRCVSAYEEHDCVIVTNYAVLERGFAGISKMVTYSAPESLQDEIVRYFMHHK